MRPIITKTSTSIVIQYWTGDMSGYTEWQISKRADICTDEIELSTFTSHGQQMTAAAGNEYVKDLERAVFIAARLDACIHNIGDFELVETFDGIYNDCRIFRNEGRIFIFVPQQKVIE